MSEEKKYTGLDVNDCCQKYGIEAVAMEFVGHIDEKDLGPEGKALLEKKRQRDILNKKDAANNSVSKFCPINSTKKDSFMVTQDTEKSIEYSKILNSFPENLADPCEGFNVKLLPEVLGSYIDTLISNNPKQAVTIAAGVFGAISALAGSKIVLNIGSKEHYPNVVILIIAPSGSGKSRALDLGIRLAKRREHACLMKIKGIQDDTFFNPSDKETIKKIKEVEARMVLAPTSGSLKGLCDHIVDADGLVLIDEYSGWYKEATEAEYNIGGEETLIKLLDTQTPYRARTGKDGCRVKDHPFLSIIGVTTTNSIRGVLKIKGTGFTERHIIFDVKDERKMRDLSNLMLNVNTVAEGSLYEHLDSMEPRKKYSLSDEALIVLNLINQKIFDLSEKYSPNGTLYPFYVRWLDSICELSMLIEFCDLSNSGNEISAKSMLAAYSYIHFAIISTISISRTFYINSLSPRRRKIELLYEAIKAFKQKNNRPMPYKEMLMLEIIDRVPECTEMLDLLVTSGRIEQVGDDKAKEYQIPNTKKESYEFI